MDKLTQAEIKRLEGQKKALQDILALLDKYAAGEPDDAKLGSYVREILLPMTQALRVPMGHMHRKP